MEVVILTSVTWLWNILGTLERASTVVVVVLVWVLMGWVMWFFSSQSLIGAGVWSDPKEHGDSCWRHSYILQLARPEEWGRNASGMTLATWHFLEKSSAWHLWVADSLLGISSIKFFSHHSQPGSNFLGKSSSFQGITLVPRLQVKAEGPWHSTVLDSLSFNRQDTPSKSETGPPALMSLSHHLGPRFILRDLSSPSGASDRKMIESLELGEQSCTFLANGS